MTNITQTLHAKTLWEFLIPYVSNYLGKTWKKMYLYFLMFHNTGQVEAIVVLFHETQWQALTNFCKIWIIKQKMFHGNAFENAASIFKCISMEQFFVCSD